MNHLILFLSIITFTTVSIQISAQESCKVLIPEIDSIYIGKCKKGLAHGKGDAFGVDSYSGRFSKGLPNGKGTYTWADGSIYTGGWMDGKLHGEGTLILKFGEKDSIVDGLWENDKYMGPKPIAPRIITKVGVDRFSIKPLYVYGRYRKYKRGIPQTKWFCRTCRGQGCEKCGFTGKMYETSVEELISEEFMVLTGGESESFHGCGREDIDARMLGNGRPFVLEIKNPRVRKLNLSEIESRINSRYDEVKVESLRFSNREEVLRIKNARFRKTYRVVIECEKTLNNQKLKKVALCLQGKTIKQITPSRVAHRRAVKTRLRKIYYCGVDSVTGSSATMTIEAESGTYIKELVSGDDGRTKPSVTELIGTPCRVVKLDVIKVEGE